MAEVKVLYDRDGKTLTVWFTESRKSTSAKLTDTLSGLKNLNFSLPDPESLDVSVETAPA